MLLYYITFTIFLIIVSIKTPSILIIIFLPLALICILFGILILCILFSTITQGFASKQWKKTKGKINTLSIKNSGWAIEIICEYFYDIEGISYNGQRGSFSFTSNKTCKSRREAKKVLEEFESSVDKKVDVYYNPKNPKESTLESGIKLSPILFGVPTSIFLLFLGIGTLIDIF